MNLNPLLEVSLRIFCSRNCTTQEATRLARELIQQTQDRKTSQQIPEQVFPQKQPTLVTNAQLDRLWTLAMSEPKLTKEEARSVLQVFGYQSSKEILQTEYNRVCLAIKQQKEKLYLSEYQIKLLKELAISNGLTISEMKLLVNKLGYEKASWIRKTEFTKIRAHFAEASVLQFIVSPIDAQCWAIAYLQQQTDKEYSLQEIERQYIELKTPKGKTKHEAWVEEIINRGRENISESSELTSEEAEEVIEEQLNPASEKSEEVLKEQLTSISEEASIPFT